MLQGRLLSYPDAHRYRLGANYEEIPVNRCPFAVNNYQRDGFMRVDGNAGASPNYWPNSFDNIVEAMKGISGPKREEIIRRQLCHWFRADGRKYEYAQGGEPSDRVPRGDRPRVSSG